MNYYDTCFSARLITRVLYYWISVLVVIVFVKFNSLFNALFSFVS